MIRSESQVSAHIAHVCMVSPGTPSFREARLNGCNIIAFVVCNAGVTCIR